MKKLNRRGFTSMEVVLLLVGLLIIVGTAIYVAQATHKSNDNLKATDSTTKVTKVAAPVSQLQIKEWGVQIGLSKTSDGDYYKSDDIKPQNPPEVIAVFSQKADAIVGPTKISCKGEPVAKILRLKTDDPKWKDPLYSGGSVAKKNVNGYSYSLGTASGVIRKCFGPVSPEGKYTDPTAKKKFETYINAITQDFNTLQASK